MTSNYGKLFGGVIAVTLLLLYAATMGFLIYHVVVCGPDSTCAAPVPITPGMVFVFTTVSGLVSALVVASLAVTEPGANPSGRFLDDNASEGRKKTVNSIVAIYLGVWVFNGLAALIVGVMLFPNANQTLSDTGTTWLGLAVAAGYAYFGIKPSE